MSIKKEHKWVVGDNRFHHPDWQIDRLDCLRFYLDENKTFPNSSEWNGEKAISLDLMLEFLNKEDFAIVQQRNFSAGIRQIILCKKGLVINIFSYAKDIDYFSDVPEFISIKKNRKIIVSTRFEVLHEELNKPKFIDKLVKYSTLKENSSRPTVNIISKDAQGFKLVEVIIDTTYNGDFDIHYGKGFTKFHNTLITKMNNTHKGIVIFHGDPGTGKTCYIRNLLCELSKSGKKRIIILPNSTINYLLDPDFTDFILELVEEMNYDDEWGDDIISYGEQSILLVIEDAEPILMKRDDMVGGNQGTSNILNMTDGIMNDIFGFQVIATFNTDLKNIDPAVLRSKRLIARKTFNKLSVEESQALIDHLKIEHTATQTLSVADIYALKESSDNTILIETIEPKHNKIGL
jgi:hypothetical protein